MNIGKAADGAELFEELLLLRGLEPAFKLEGAVEMILNRIFPIAGDDQDLVDSGGRRLFDDILNHRFVDKRNQLFRHGLGEREEARAESGGGNDGLANLLHRAHPVPTISGLITLIPSVFRTRTSSQYIFSFS